MSDSNPDEPRDRTSDEEVDHRADPADEQYSADATTGAGTDTTATDSGSPDRSSTASTGDEPPHDTGDSTNRSDRGAFWGSIAFALLLGVVAISLVTARAPFFENVLRVRPTIDGGGIGADWVVGNTGPILEAAIFLVHLADVVMGIFILLMVFVHWAAFRRLAVRMRPPSGRPRERESTAATDGGERSDGGEPR